MASNGLESIHPILTLKSFKVCWWSFIDRVTLKSSSNQKQIVFWTHTNPGMPEIVTYHIPIHCGENSDYESWNNGSSGRSLIANPRLQLLGKPGKPGKPLDLPPEPRDVQGRTCGIDVGGCASRSLHDCTSVLIICQKKRAELSMRPIEGRGQNSSSLAALALHRFTLYQSKRPQTPFSNLKPWFKHATKDLGSEHVFSLRNSVFPSVSVGFLHTKCYTKSAIYISPACGTHSRSSSQHPGTSPRWQSFCSKLAARFGKAVQQRSQRSVERTFEGDLAYASAASAPFTLFFLIHLILEKSWKNACGLHTRDRPVICFAASQTQIHRYTMTMIYIEFTLIYRLVMFS